MIMEQKCSVEDALFKVISSVWRPHSQNQVSTKDKVFKCGSKAVEFFT